MTRINLRDLCPYQTDIQIRVRICRIWRGTMTRNGEEINCGLHCVLVDEMNDAIQAFVPETDVTKVSPQLNQGTVYDISHFYTRPNPDTYRVVNTDVRAFFNGRTIFNQQAHTSSKIPMHRFYLQDYESLKDRLTNDAILSDVFGKLYSVSPVETAIVGNRPAPKRDIVLELTSGEKLRITLWGQNAHKFNTEEIKDIQPPPLIVFSSTKVREFKSAITLSSSYCTQWFVNPQIPEADAWKQHFSQTDKIIWPEPTPVLDIADVPKITVQQLNILNPAEYKNKSVFCKASIKKILSENGWWYRACYFCNKPMKQHQHTTKFFCEQHGEERDRQRTASYKVSMTIEDETDETAVKIIGKLGEKLFGASCTNIVFHEQHTSQTEIPRQLHEAEKMVRIFEIRFDKTDEFITKGIHTDPNENNTLDQSLKKKAAQTVEEEPATSTSYKQQRSSQEETETCTSNQPFEDSQGTESQ